MLRERGGEARYRLPYARTVGCTVAPGLDAARPPR